MLGAGIADVSGIANIADIVDVADIATGIADIVTDIADIVTDIAGIADQVLQTLRWKQVGVYKVSQGCPITIYANINSNYFLLEYIFSTVLVLPAVFIFN